MLCVSNASDCPSPLTHGSCNPACLRPTLHSCDAQKPFTWATIWANEQSPRGRKTEIRELWDKAVGEIGDRKSQSIICGEKTDWSAPLVWPRGRWWPSSTTRLRLVTSSAWQAAWCACTACVDLKAWNSTHVVRRCLHRVFSCRAVWLLFVGQVHSRKTSLLHWMWTQGEAVYLQWVYNGHDDDDDDVRWGGCHVRWTLHQPFAFKFYPC